MSTDRVEFEMSEAQLNTLRSDMSSVYYTVLEGPSPMDDVRNAWKRLGDEMGFDHMTVFPSRTNEGARFFRATPKAHTPTKEHPVAKDLDSTLKIRVQAHVQLVGGPHITKVTNLTNLTSDGPDDPQYQTSQAVPQVMITAYYRSTGVPNKILEKVQDWATKLKHPPTLWQTIRQARDIGFTEGWAGSQKSKADEMAKLYLESKNLYDKCREKADRELKEKEEFHQQKAARAVERADRREGNFIRKLGEATAATDKLAARYSALEDSLTRVLLNVADERARREGNALQNRLSEAVNFDDDGTLLNVNTLMRIAYEIGVDDAGDSDDK